MAVESDVFARGGEGGIELAEAVVAATAQPSSPRPLYSNDLSLETKIDTVAREIYGAGAVYFESGTRKKLQQLATLEGGGLREDCDGRDDDEGDYKRAHLRAPFQSTDALPILKA